MKKLTTLLFVLIFASSMAFAQSNETDITQTTNNNSANVAQDGNSNEATVVQKAGNNNTALINQYSTTVSDDGDIVSTIRQVGAGNYAAANGSRKNYAGSETMQRQVGNNNVAKINQDDGVGSNEGTSLSQVQLGSQNRAEMNGGNSYSATQHQDGFSNEAKTWGNGKNGDVTQKQYGNNNRSVAHGLSYSDALQYQDGNQNVSLLENISHDGPGEYYETHQWGFDNSATLSAGGNGGKLDIDQNGNVNSANVTWSTSMNEAVINQNGSGNSANVTSN